MRSAAGITVLQVDSGTVAFTPRGGPVRLVGAGERAEAGRAQAADDALAAWWPLDEGSGTTAGDASGRSHAGRIAGPRWTPEGLHFAGGDDHIEIEPVGDLAGVQEGDYSLTAWFRPEALPPREARDQPGSGRDDLSVIVGRAGWTLGLHLGSDGRFFMQHFLADRSSRACHSTGRAVLGRWHHLAGVVDRTRGETRLAVDGVFAPPSRWPAAGAASFAYGPERLWRIGISTPKVEDCRWPSRGHIRDVRIYARALSADDIRRLAAAP